MRMFRILVVLLASVLSCQTVMAAGMAAPEGRVLLTVSGSIGVHNGDGMAAFDRKMLMGLDWREVRTFTSFTEGEQVFAGPTLASLLEAVQANGATISATAINDYTVQFPVTDADAHSVLLAMDQNGRPMRVRDKGPIWVVYPLSEKEAAQQRFDSEMIWQLDRLLIE